MKTRQGFVSNSSSSSFLLIGDYFEPKWDNIRDEMIEFAKEKGLDTAELESLDREPDFYEAAEMISPLLEDKGFDTYFGECGLYYGIIILAEDVAPSVTGLIEQLQKAQIRAKKLGLKDTIALEYDGA